MKDKNTKQEEKIYTKFDKQLGDFFLGIYKEIGIAGTILVIIMLLIGFIWLISQEPIKCLTFDIAASHNIGDAMGGMLSPVIGLIAVVLTFMAFYVQYQFNQKQFRFYQQDKVDRKNDEYHKILDSILQKDKYKDGEVRFILEFSTKSLVTIIKHKNIINGTSFSDIVYKNYIAYYAKYRQEINKGKNLFTTASILDEQREFTQIQIEILLEVYENFFKHLLAFVQELNNIEIDDTDKEKAILSFYNKFEILYHNYSEDFLNLVFNYYSKMELESEHGNKNTPIIMKVLNHYSLNNLDIVDIDDVVDSIIDENKKSLVRFQNMFKDEL